MHISFIISGLSDTRVFDKFDVWNDDADLILILLIFPHEFRILKTLPTRLKGYFGKIAWMTSAI